MRGAPLIVGALSLLFAEATAGCPCADPALCNQITTGPRKEVFGFSVTGGKYWEHGYDWSQLTTIAWVKDPQVMCKAHAMGARAVLNTGGNWKQLFTNASARLEWINKLVQTAVDNHLDGANFDYEDPIAIDSDTREQYKTLIAETTAAFHTAIPGSQVTMDAAWSPDNIDGRNYDWVGISEACDFMFVMAYDTRSQIFGRCIASANTPAEVARHGIERFLELGIPANKLVLGLPWYGYDYPCANTTDPTVQYCPIEAVPFRNITCSDAAGKELNYANVRQILASPIATTARQWDPTLRSPYFNYRNATTGKIHQMWYDDPESLSIKYGIAKDMGLRGVGFWHLDALDYDGSVSGSVGIREAKEMWNAVRAFTGKATNDAVVV